MFTLALGLAVPAVAAACLADPNPRGGTNLTTEPEEAEVLAPPEWFAMANDTPGLSTCGGKGQEPCTLDELIVRGVQCPGYGKTWEDDEGERVCRNTLEPDDIDLDTDEPDGTAATQSGADRPSTTPAPDLRLAADLCTDLGRSANATELPPLLAQAAQLLNASCIIVWVRDGTGNALRPAISHGYPAAALARLGTIACDGDNVTAAAYRDSRMHVIPGDAETPGAIVVPLVSPEDRPGVMTLEVNDGWEASDTVQSTATIIAAQLATLVGADPVDSSAEQAHG